MSSPQGDGNKRPLPLLRHCPIAIYPREGTKTSTTMAVCTSTMIAIYPREGTKTCRVFACSQWLCNCNLSPRGDENLSKYLAALSVPTSLQFIPARGRKLCQKTDTLAWRTIAIYPRKGTETSSACNALRCTAQIAIYPRKGTETLLSACCIGGQDIAIYPRKGTETVFA